MWGQPFRLGVKPQQMQLLPNVNFCELLEQWMPHVVFTYIITLYQICEHSSTESFFKAKSLLGREK